MIKTLKGEDSDYQEMTNIDEDINLKKISGTLNRNKKSISLSALIFFVVTVFYSYTIPKTWKGNFQIVLSPESKNSSRLNAFAGSSLSRLAGGSFGNDDLMTEVEKLKSPSVLLKVFDFYKKQLDDKSYDKNIIYEEWIKKFNINLTSKTTVLSINYKDKNKEQILPVLNKVSEVYKNYSNKQRNKKLDNSLIYLNNQLEEYKIKSLNSLKKAQGFATKNNLIFDDNDTNSNKFKPLDDQNFETTDLMSNPSIDVETRRVLASNNIEVLKIQLSNIQQIDSDLKTIEYLSASSPNLQNLLSYYLAEINVIDNKLVNLRISFKDSDPLIQRLEKKRKSYLEVIKNKTIEFLKAQKSKEEAILKASIRDDEIMVKFKELLRENRSNNSTLINLEEQIKSTNLEKARNQEPWQLITNPTLFKFPIYPVKKRLAFLGTLLGLLIGIIYSFIKESRSKKIYYEEDLEKILVYPKISTIKNLSEDDNNFIALEYSLKKFSSSKDNICIFPIGEINKEFIKEFLDKLRSLKFNFNIETCYDSRLLENYKNAYLVTSKGSTTATQIYEIMNLIEISNTNIIGWILLDR